MCLEIEFQLDGDLARLCLAEPLPPERADRLWEHTCFEVFVATPGDESYLEWNLAPSRRWAAYTFSAYRERAGEVNDAAPAISVERRDDGMALRALLPLEGWLAERRPRQLELGLSAVIETTTRELSYWAIQHHADRPDFHHRRTFDLVLQPQC